MSQPFPRMSQAQFARAAAEIRECTAMLPAHQRFWWRTRVDWLMRQVRKRELSLNVDGPMLCRIGRSVYHLLSIVGIWANKTLIDAYLDKLRGALTALGCRP